MAHLYSTRTGQASEGRVVINLGESSASVPQLMREFTQRRGDVRQLSEVLVVRKGTVTRIYP